MTDIKLASISHFKSIVTDAGAATAFARAESVRISKAGRRRHGLIAGTRCTPGHAGQVPGRRDGSGLQDE